MSVVVSPSRLLSTFCARNSRCSRFIAAYCFSKQLFSVSYTFSYRLESSTAYAIASITTQADAANVSSRPEEVLQRRKRTKEEYRAWLKRFNALLLHDESQAIDTAALFSLVEEIESYSLYNLRAANKVPSKMERAVMAYLHVAMNEAVQMNLAGRASEDASSPEVKQDRYGNSKFTIFRTRNYLARIITAEFGPDFVADNILRVNAIYLSIGMLSKAPYRGFYFSEHTPIILTNLLYLCLFEDRLPYTDTIINLRKRPYQLLRAVNEAIDAIYHNFLDATYPYILIKPMITGFPDNESTRYALRTFLVRARAFPLDLKLEVINLAYSHGILVESSVLYRIMLDALSSKNGEIAAELSRLLTQSGRPFDLHVALSLFAYDTQLATRMLFYVGNYELIWNGVVVVTRLGAAIAAKDKYTQSSIVNEILRRVRLFGVENAVYDSCFRTTSQRSRFEYIYRHITGTLATSVRANQCPREDLLTWQYFVKHQLVDNYIPAKEPKTKSKKLQYGEQALAANVGTNRTEAIALSSCSHVEPDAKGEYINVNQRIVIYRNHWSLL